MRRPTQIGQRSGGHSKAGQNPALDREPRRHNQQQIQDVHIDSRWEVLGHYDMIGQDTSGHNRVWFVFNALSKPVDTTGS